MIDMILIFWFNGYFYSNKVTRFKPQTNKNGNFDKRVAQTIV